MNRRAGEGSADGARDRGGRTNQQGATVYIAAAGTMVGPGPGPQSIDLNLIRASTGDDEQYGWDGLLLPM